MNTKRQAVLNENPTKTLRKDNPILNKLFRRRESKQSLQLNVMIPDQSECQQ